MQIANLNTGSQIWTQVYSDEGGGTVIYGPVKLNVAAMTNSTSLNLEKTGSSIDFSGTAGSRTYTLQIAIFNNGTFTLVATAASLILHDQKK